MERGGHAGVAGEQAEAADAPIAAALSQLLGVDGEVGAMEAAHTDVGDARHEPGAVVRRDRDAAGGDRLEVGVAELERGWGVLRCHGPAR